MVRVGQGEYALPQKQAFTIIPMGVNADVGVVGETEVHDAAEYPVGLRITGYTVD